MTSTGPSAGVLGVQPAEPRTGVQRRTHQRDRVVEHPHAAHVQAIELPGTRQETRNACGLAVGPDIVGDVPVQDLVDRCIAGQGRERERKGHVAGARTAGSGRVRNRTPAAGRWPPRSAAPRGGTRSRCRPRTGRHSCRSRTARCSGPRAGDRCLRAPVPRPAPPACAASDPGPVDCASEGAALQASRLAASARGTRVPTR